MGEGYNRLCQNIGYSLTEINHLIRVRRRIVRAIAIPRVLKSNYL